MKSRLKAFGYHFCGSIAALLLVLGTLYLGWYRWPGWYLTGLLHVLPVMVGVDVALGPLMTLIIADPRKPRRVLARDIGVIVVVQLAALVYGSIALWQGRPLYYAFSENQLEVVQASDLDATEVELGRQHNPDFAPHWYSLPRWIWAPLPPDPKTRDSIVTAAVTGGNDVTNMPRYFKPWSQGLPDLRKQLKKVDELRFFSGQQKKALERRMTQMGLSVEESSTIPMTGRGVPLLAVFDLRTLQMKALLRP